MLQQWSCLRNTDFTTDSSLFVGDIFEFFREASLSFWRSARLLGLVIFEVFEVHGARIHRPVRLYLRLGHVTEERESWAGRENGNEI